MEADPKLRRWQPKELTAEEKARQLGVSDAYFELEAMMEWRTDPERWAGLSLDSRARMLAHLMMRGQRQRWQTERDDKRAEDKPKAAAPWDQMFDRLMKK